jgi:hypothetical protein
MTPPADDTTIRQFEVLWAEIARRSNAQQALLAATVTATGTVGGLVVSGRADPVLLVVLAVVAPVFGLLWIDHAQNIGEIGKFIRRNWPGSPNWEQENEERKNTPAGRLRFLIFMPTMSLVFLGPALGGLAASVCQLDGTLYLIAAWGGAAVVTGLFSISWAIQVQRTWPKGSEPYPDPGDAS